MNEAATRTSGAKVVIGLSLGALAGLALLLSPIAFALFVGVFLLAALYELDRLLRALGVSPSWVGFVVVGCLCGVAYRGPEALLAYAPGIVAAGVVLTFVSRVLKGAAEGSLPAVVSSVASFVYIGVLGSFLIALRATPFGFRVVLAFGLMATMNDAFSFFVGTIAGRHLLAKTISPHKTWEGFAGGTIASFVVAAIVHATMHHPFSGSRAFLLAALVSIAMPLGDLSESAMKREAGVKDSGRLFGTHGGALDRIDGILFAAPLFYLSYRIMIR
ncbi:MAG: phosphatidate cytidylyltransferase [Actinomycetota bacterium]